MALSHLGRYEIESQLGEGAMGTVYRARDRGLGRVVALKVLSAEATGDELYRRFRREAEAVGRLDHPHIVKVFDFGEADGRPYMAMELLEGDDLRCLIEEPAPLTTSDRLRIMIEICEGLAYAHSRGVVHRDIKPANIIVTSSGVTKILDFGLARVAADSTITRKGVILGTPDYMCPEQAMGRTVDPRSDVFAAGSVFYEFLSLHKPFNGKTLHSVLYQIISERPTALLTLNPELPARAAELVHRMLEKSPDERLQSMDEVGAALRDIREGLRRSRGRSTVLPQRSQRTDPEPERRRAGECLARARAHLEAGRFAQALGEAREAAGLAPEAPEGVEILWRSLRREPRTARRTPFDVANEDRVRALLDQAAPGRPEEDARRALAELALIAPDDPRVAELVRDRAEAAREVL